VTHPLVDRLAQEVVSEVLSRHTRFRGSFQDDDRITLVTVTWHTNDFALRLLRSWRRFNPDPTAPAIVVDNAPRPGAKTAFEALGARYLTAGLNLNHGPGLELGMRFVDTQYTLVADPDTAIVSAEFLGAVRARLAAHGVASVDTGMMHYHPLCVAFPTELWKYGGFSFQARWPFWDVGGELTKLQGGVRTDALIGKRRSYGPALAPMLGGHDVHHLGEVYGDVFTSTYGAARLIAEPERTDFDGWERADMVAFHERWGEWVDDVLVGRSTVDAFPSGADHE
jgi:hypothetical protein